MKNIIAAILAALALTGCMSGMRLKPGHTATSIGPDGVLMANAVQSQDPKEPMTQTVTTQASDEKIIPAGSVVEMVTPGKTNSPVEKITLSQPMPVKSATVHTIETKVGGAQKNTAAEIGAKLASFKWIQWFGVLLALFGIATLAYPPLRLIINSVTTSAWVIGAGAAMVFLPVVIVGHEVLIMALGGGGAALWFLAHRHGGVTGELAALKNVWSEITSKPAPAASPAPAPAETVAPAPASPFKK